MDTQSQSQKYHWYIRQTVYGDNDWLTREHPRLMHYSSGPLGPIPNRAQHDIEMGTWCHLYVIQKFGQRVRWPKIRLVCSLMRCPRCQSAIRKSPVICIGLPRLPANGYCSLCINICFQSRHIYVLSLATTNTSVNAGLVLICLYISFGIWASCKECALVNWTS